MNSTGMVRKIDELGRIVIPKEIRKNINIHDGEELEIYINNNSIILKKINSFLTNKNCLKNIIKGYHDIYGINMMIINSDDNLDSFIQDLIRDRSRYLSTDKETFFNIDAYFYMEPLIIDSTCYGLIVIYDDQLIKEEYINGVKLMIRLFDSIYDIN